MITGVYLINSVGVPVYYHYCDGELESVSALFKSDVCCGEMETEEEDSDCCKNEVKIIAQFNDTYSEVNSFKVNKPLNPVFALSYWSTSAVLLSEKSSLIFPSFPYKPPSPGRKILDLKSVLII